MNKFNTKIIYPLVGSIGLTAYLFENNKYVLNYKNRKLIEDLQFKSTVLVMEHFQINKTYGNVLTTTIERDSVLHNLNKTKTNLNFEMKIKKGKNLDLDDYFASVQVNSSLQEGNTKWNIDSLDIQFLNPKSKILKRLYESLNIPKETLYSDETIFRRIKNSNRLVLDESKECLLKLKKDLPNVLNSIDQLLNDEKKLEIIGVPIALKLDSIHLNNKLIVKIIVKGKKQTANLYISGDKLTNDLVHIGVMYELDEDSFLSTTDLANKYTEKIMSENSQLKEILDELNLAKIIEDKLFKNTRALDSIGRPIQLDNYLITHESLGAQLVLVFKGKLNSAKLIIDLVKDDQNKWKINKSQLKMIWD